MAESKINSKISHKGIGVILNSTGNEYFTHTATNGYILNGVYTLLIGLTTKKILPTSSAFNIGTVSELPTHTLPGFMVVTNSNILAGGVYIESSDGSIHIRVSDETPANRNIVINVTGFYTIT